MGKARAGQLQSPAFTDECRRVLQSLRGALIEGMGGVGVDASRPRQAARLLGLDKNLAWKVSKIIGQPDVFQSVGHVPGRAGFEILCGALTKQGSPPATVERMRDALTDFDRMVERHTGDRATLELLAGSYGQAEHQREAAEQARRLAFRGHSAVWSVQARMQVAASILAPSADDPDMVDVAQLRALVDLRRLRPDVRWLLSRNQVHQDTDQSGRGEHGEPYEPVTPSGFPLIRQFSSADLPEVHVEDLGDELQFQLGEGAVGRTAEVTCVWGSVVRALGSQYGDEDNQYSQVGANLITPVEWFQADILVHRDFEWAMEPAAALYGTLDGRMTHVGSGREGTRLPVGDPVVELGWGTAATVTPHLPRYAEMLDWVFRRVGWNPDDFRCFRFEMAYPPIPTHALLYAPLRQPPEGGAP